MEHPLGQGRVERQDVASGRDPSGGKGSEGTVRSLRALSEAIISCTRCPRLLAHCRDIAATKRRAYADWDYWGKPLPGFGDPKARLLIIGLAPAAHGGNRTGRMFTGDASADWLVEAMYTYGFANQPRSVSRDDGLQLKDAYVTAAARCAPPDNRPTAAELRNCQPFLERELGLLEHVRVVLVLGQIAFETYWRVLRAKNHVGSGVKRPRFAHGARYRFGPDMPILLMSYHPSRQNTQTGRLTRAMFHQVFATARAILDGCDDGSGDAASRFPE